MLYSCNVVRGFCGGSVGMVVATMTINNWFMEMNGLAITLFNALGSVLIGSLYDKLGSYSGIILMVAVMMAVVMVIIVMAYRKKANQMKSI